MDYNGTSPATATVSGAGANRRRDTSSNDDHARGRLDDQHLDGGGGNARTSALSAAAAGGIGKDGPYEYDPSASGASQFGWIGAGFKFEGVADTSFGQDDYHMHHAIKELSREPAPSSSSSSAAQQRKAAVNAATDTTGAGRGVSSRGPSTAPIASPASGAAPSIQSSKSAPVQLSHPPSGSRSSVPAVRPLGQPQQQQHNAPQMEHHQRPEQQHVDRHQHHQQQHGGSDDRGSVISEASLAPSLTRLRAAAEQAIAATKVMQDRSERADYEAYQQRVKEQWSRAHGGAAGTGASAAQPAEAASVTAASHYNVRRSSVMSRATAHTAHTQASAAGRNVSSSSSAQQPYLQQQQLQTNTSREREWNGSTEMPSGPGLQGAVSIPASSVDRERERSATHAKAVNVLQLSPARARVVQLQASAVSSGSAAARPPLPPTGAQLAPGAAPALSAAGPANTAVTGSNVSPSAGGAVSGIKVGSLVDPSYVPRIALPVSAAVPVLPPSINRRSMVGGSSSSGAGQNANGSQASGGGVVAASANNSGSGNMILNFSTASAGTSGSAQQLQQAANPAPAEAPKPAAASAAACECDEFSLCSPKQKVMLKWIRSLGVEISPEMRCAYSVVSQAEVLECLAESAHRRGSVYEDEERTFQRYFSGIDEGYGERDGDDAATASGAGRRSKFEPALLPRMLCDGIFLSELVCSCETRSGNRIPTMQMRIPGYAAFRDRADGAATETGTIGGWQSRADARSVISGRTGATSAFTGHGGSTKSGMLTLVPGTVLPRDNSLSPAAAVKNIELALEILRARPRVNSRYLWSGDDLRRGLSIDTAWGILEDLHRAYGGVTRTATSPSKKRQQQQQLQEQAQAKTGEAPAESGESAPLAAPSSTAAAGSGEAPEVDEASLRQQQQQAVQPLGNAQLLPPHLMAAGAAAGGSVASHHQQHHHLHVSDLSSAHGTHGAVAVSIVTGAANGADIQVDGTHAKFVLPAGKFNVGAGELAASSSSGASVAGDGDGAASVAPSISGASASAIDRKYSKRRVLPILPDPLPVPEHLLVHLPALASALGVDPRAHAAAVKAHHQQQQQQKTRANVGGTQAGVVGFAKVTELQISEVRTWLHSLELSNVAPLNEEGVHHVLDNPLFNGCLLAAIMKTIAPDTPPLCGPKPYRHFEKPKSFAEARANNEASLRCLKQCPLMTQIESTPLLQAAPDHQSSSSSVGRGSSRDGVAAWNSSTRVDGESPLPARHAHLGYGSSTSDHAHVRNLNVDLSSNPSSSEGFKVVPPPTIPELYLYCCEEMLVGNHDAAWGLLWHICRLHSYRRQVELAKAELLRPVSATSGGSNGGQAAGDEAAPPASPSRRSARSSASGGGGGAGGVRFDLSSNTYVSIDGRPAQPPLSPGKRYNMTEVQVMEWLAGMGLYRALGLSDADVEILERANSRDDVGADAGFGSTSSNNRKSGLRTIDYIIGPLCDGTLLADIARILLAGIIAQSSTQSGDVAALSGKDSIGNSITADVYLHQPAFASAVSALSIITSVDPSPRTEAVAMSNIQKSIEALRSIDGLSRRWTTKPDIVQLLFQGQPEAACGLLFDCMSFARSRRITGKVGFGSSSGNIGRSSSRLRREAEQIAAAEALAAAQARAARQARRRLSYDTRDDGAASVASSVRSRKDAASLLSLDAGEDRSKAGRTSLEDEEAYAARIAAGAAGTASDGQGTGSSGPNSGKAEGSGEPAGIPGPESDATIDGAILVRWLSSLDIFVTRPDDLAITTQSAPEFSDGVLLCRVIEACENMRGFNRDPIPGVDRYPTTGAAKLGNIRKGLAVLRSHPSMPLELLWSEGKIREAHAPTIRKLLAQIRRAYGHHLFSHYHDLHPKPEAHEASPLRKMAAVGVSPAARGLQLQSDEPHAAVSAARNAVTGAGAAASSSAAASAIARSASASRRQSVQSVGSLPPSGRRQPG